MSIFINRFLTTYWMSFPEDSNYPSGIGVTAYSIEDAQSLLDERNFDYYKSAKKVIVEENVDWAYAMHKLRYIDRPNLGPLVIRGIWWPNLNSS